jgi:hypothetical protein
MDVKIKMNVYWFGRHLDKDFGYVSDLLEDSGFSGWLLPYAVGVPDPFVRIARGLKTDQKLKYLVAVRPYNISPQYLLAISQSLDLIQEDRVRINFVPGLILNDSEKFFGGGGISEINDSSSWEDRKKYFCSYIEEFYNLKTKKPYTYVSGFPDDLCPQMSNFGDCNIVSYGRLFEGKLNNFKKNGMIFFPVYKIEQFKERMEHVKQNGYSNIMIHTDGDGDFDLALEVFNEVKKLKNQTL